MKKSLLPILLVISIALGCDRSPENKDVLVRINDYEITRNEFNEEFKNSTYANNDTPESKKDFLANLINRKLILQDAERDGLSRDKSFLKMVERFWEQSLLKLALDKKVKELSGSVVVTDKEIKEAYDKMVKEGNVDKPYDQMYGQIKWQIAKIKESHAMDNWLTDLRKKSRIKIEHNSLNK